MEKLRLTTSLVENEKPHDDAETTSDDGVWRAVSVGARRPVVVVDEISESPKAGARSAAYNGVPARARTQRNHARTSHVSSCLPPSRFSFFPLVFCTPPFHLGFFLSVVR